MNGSLENAPGHAQILLNKIQCRQIKVAVVGLGYVGLSLALRLADAGLKVSGIDTDRQRIDHLREGRSYLSHIPDESIRAALHAGLVVYEDLISIREADVVVICLPTQVIDPKTPDLTFILELGAQLVSHARPGQMFSLESTTFPGTTEEVLRPMLETNGLRVGEQIFLVYSPERIDPGNVRYELRDIPKIVSGVTSTCRSLGEAFYKIAVDKVVCVSSTRAAEFTKLLENIHRAVNIALANELKIIADRFGIDIFEVVEAAASKPFGFSPFFPGPGLGGPCIPFAPAYMMWKANEAGVETSLMQAAHRVNQSMPAWIVSKAVEALSARGRSIRHCRLLVAGVAYKKNIGDARVSPGLEIIERFQQLGATVQYSDPFIPSLQSSRSETAPLRSIEMTADVLTSVDAVILVTDHDRFDYEAMASHAPLIVDTRGRYRDLSHNIVRA